MSKFLKVSCLVVLIGLVIAGSCGTGVLIGAALRTGPLEGIGKDAVAVVYVEGAIQSGQDGGIFGASGAAYSDTIIRWLRRAQDDRSVKAVVLRVDSPGGGITPSDEIRNQVAKLAKTKSVVASFGAVAASGGYYVSAPAEKVYANETSITGSIGAISIVPNVQGLLEKLGIETYIFKSGPQKDETTGLRPLTEADRKILQGMIDDAYERFVQVVSEGRGMNADAVRRVADGRIYTGKQAKALGLVDEIGDLPEAIQGAAQLGGIKGEPRVIRFRAGGVFSGASSALLGWLGLPAAPPLPGRSQSAFSLHYLFLVP
ncbi:MAG: signal peptide peptidase SppA [Chloroflexi bacterium]|nr:signal peptide peptidase SppA [Chloroflexota bacterium]